MASIDKLPSGRFRVRWRGPDNRQHSESRASKADAEALRRRIERDLDDGYLTSAADRRITISEYVNRNGGWLASQAWRTSTRDNFDSQWRAHLEPRWGHVAVRSVRRTDFQGWVNELSAAGLAPGTVAGVYKRLVQILRAAHLDGVLPRQPVLGVTLPEKRPEATQPLQVPTLEQVKAMADAVPDRYEALVWTCATLGLRPGDGRDGRELSQGHGPGDRRGRPDSRRDRGDRDPRSPHRPRRHAPRSRNVSASGCGRFGDHGQGREGVR